jgi:hypothetical protein
MVRAEKKPKELLIFLSNGAIWARRRLAVHCEHTRRRAARHSAKYADTPACAYASTAKVGVTVLSAGLVDGCNLPARGAIAVRAPDGHVVSIIRRTSLENSSPGGRREPYLRSEYFIIAISSSTGVRASRIAAVVRSSVGSVMTVAFGPVRTFGPRFFDFGKVRTLLACGLSMINP